MARGSGRMERVTLGRTGLEVSRLGIGLSEIGYNLELDADGRERAFWVINAALDAGVNFLDTAACYEISEEMLGATVAHRRDEFVLATKAGHFVPSGTGPDWTYQTVADSIDRSLARMQTDYLDLVQLHSCNVAILQRGEVIQALQDARQAGKTRFIGYSGDGVSAAWAVRSDLFDTLQTSFSLVDQSARTRLFPAARAHGMGIIIKRPIGNAVWGAPADPRPYEHNPQYAFEYFRRAQQMQADGPVAEEPDDRIVLALGFTLGHPEVNVAIVGTGRPEHMESNLEIVENRLPISDAAIADLHRRWDSVGGSWEQRG